MDNSKRKITARRNWLKIYNEMGSVTKTALRCGIARSTLYRWLKRAEEGGELELSDKSRRPKSSHQQQLAEMCLIILSYHTSDERHPQNKRRVMVFNLPVAEKPRDIRRRLLPLFAVRDGVSSLAGRYP